MVQALLTLGDSHHRYNNSPEVIRLQNEAISVQGREVQSLKQRLAEVEDLLARRDADVEKKTAELEGKADELERVKTLNGQLEGKLEDSSVEVRGLQGQVQVFKGKSGIFKGKSRILRGKSLRYGRRTKKWLPPSRRIKKLLKNTTKTFFLTAFIMSGSLINL